MKQSDIFEKIVKIEEEILQTTDISRLEFLQDELSELEKCCDRINKKSKKVKQKNIKI